MKTKDLFHERINIWKVLPIRKSWESVVPYNPINFFLRLTLYFGILHHAGNKHHDRVIRLSIHGELDVVTIFRLLCHTVSYPAECNKRPH